LRKWFHRGRSGKPVETLAIRSTRTNVLMVANVELP